MNSIAAFQMVQALDAERLHQAEKRRMARKLHAPSTAQEPKMSSGNWRSILRLPRFTAAASKS